MIASTYGCCVEALWREDDCKEQTHIANCTAYYNECNKFQLDATSFITHKMREIDATKSIMWNNPRILSNLCPSAMALRATL